MIIRWIGQSGYIIKTQSTEIIIDPYLSDVVNRVAKRPRLVEAPIFSISEYTPDITFICINGRLGNMNVDEAVITAGKIGAKVNVPNHYGMFASNTEDPHAFTERIDNGFIMDFIEWLSFNSFCKVSRSS